MSSILNPVGLAGAPVPVYMEDIIMNKKVISTLLAAASVITLIGCGSSTTAKTDETAAENSTVQTTEAAAEAASSGEGSVVTFSYPTLVVTPTPEGVAPVEDALNDYLKSIGKNYTVDLNPIDGNNYPTQTDMAIMSNENVGIYCPLAGLSNAVSSNKLLPLDDYLGAELKPVVDLEGDQMLRSGKVDGITYAMPCYKGYILYYYWVVDKDIFDATGFAGNDITDIRSLTPILEKIHEQNPDIAAIAPTLGLNGTGNNYCQLPTMGDPDDYKVTDLGSFLGLIVEGDSTKVENMYETQYFKEACELAYDWNQKGLTIKDASVTTDTPTDTQQAGRAASNIIGYGNSAESVAAFTDNTYAFPISKTMMASNSLVWGIASNCSNPRESADFLSLLYTDEQVINYIIYGTEGDDYVVTGEENGIKTIAYPEGQDMNSVPYTAQLSCGILGNQFIMYAIEGGTSPADISFMKENMDKAVYSPVFGYQIDVTPVSTQASAISNAANQYTGGLLCGELDPKTYIPQLIDAVNAAGMQDVIAVAQDQLDAWKTEQ